MILLTLERCKKVNINTIPVKAAYLPWRLSETPPIITTEDIKKSKVNKAK
tara:strand:+ start:481 stop:630 length:150 start_codon:yes stop_codon:yes gene_type:complete